MRWVLIGVRDESRSLMYILMTMFELGSGRMFMTAGKFVHV